MSDVAALVRRWDEAMSAKDAAAAAAMSPEDVEYRDHRALGWETLNGRAAVQAWYQSMMDGVERIDVRSEIIEDRGEAILMRQAATFRARESDGGGEGSLVMTALVTLRDDLFAKIEIFEDGAAPA